MSTLGIAIARYLCQLGGEYSIELPGALRQDCESLVAKANEIEPARALFVSSESKHTEGRISWPQLVGWRTGHPRIFVWARGDGEPDSSFQSVVKPFIDGHFPGIGSSLCTLLDLVTLATDFIFESRHLPPSGPTYDAFVETLGWVSEAFVRKFRESGNTPFESWGDLFLEHFSRLIDDLNLVVPDALLEQHAWEIIRLAGLPIYVAPDELPAALSKSPPVLDDREADKVLDVWGELFQEHDFSGAGKANVLNVLDHVLRARAGAVPNTWRTLTLHNNHEELRTRWLLAAQAMFGRSQCPAIEPTQAPEAGTKCWWGVTYDDLQAALTTLNNTGPVELQQTPVCIRTPLNGSDTFLLLSRSGTIFPQGTKGKWTTELEAVGCRVVLRRKACHWSALYCDKNRPPLEDGEAWLGRTNISPKLSGGKVAVTSVIATAAGDLVIDFDIAVKYQFGGTRRVQGKWSPGRTLSMDLIVHEAVNGAIVERLIQEKFTFIIPSPFEITLLVGDDGSNKPIITPSKDDLFTLDSSGVWSSGNSLDLFLTKEGRYDVCAYDGRISAATRSFEASTAGIRVAGREITELQPHAEVAGLYSGEAVLSDATTIESDRVIATVSVEKPTIDVTSGVLRGITSGPDIPSEPSIESRESFFGQYETKIGNAIREASEDETNSFYQFVVPTGNNLMNWPVHDGSRKPQFISVTDEILPWVGAGLTEKVETTTEWGSFRQCTQSVLRSLGVTRSLSPDMWISMLNPGKLTLEQVRSYIATHAALIKKSREFSAADGFWASYPFSVVVVCGEPGAKHNQVTSVFLSPLHPVRLGWAFAATKLGKCVAQDPEYARLLGLIDGWNLPAIGFTVGPGEKRIPMIAMPTHPGADGDFVAWSALAVLDSMGLPELPAEAGGRTLPWSGRTGINRHIVTQALSDYVTTHPHVTSLTVDVRCASEGARSKEIDGALLDILGNLDRQTFASQLRGGATVFDSTYRLGIPPSRDDLFKVRGDESTYPFEWRTYAPNSSPRANVALIEDANVNVVLADTPSSAYGALGPVPIRRFSSTQIESGFVDEHIKLSPNADEIGLSDLLSVMESWHSLPTPVLRTAANPNALGLEGRSAWEVLGTFHLDPGQLSNAVAKVGKSRVVWEWRPSWLLARNSGELSLAQRPYFVVAEVPSSVRYGLLKRQKLDESRVNGVLRYLGEKGIGLAPLIADEGTHEAAALGFFYALRLFLNGEVAAPSTWLKDLKAPNNHYNHFALLPVDPVAGFLQALAGKKFRERCDFVGMLIQTSEREGTRIILTPVEVKHYGSPEKPFVPNTVFDDLKHARKQLKESIGWSTEIASALSDTSNAAPAYLRRNGVAALTELAFSLAGSDIAPDLKATAIADILSGRLSVDVSDAFLIWFAVGSGTLKVNPFGAVPGIHEVFIDPTKFASLWFADAPPNTEDDAARTAIDREIGLAFGIASAAPISPNVDLDLRAILRDGESDIKAVTRDTATVQQTPAKPPEGTPSPTISVVDDSGEEHPSVDLSTNAPSASGPSSGASEVAPEPPQTASSDQNHIVERRELRPSLFVGSTSESARWVLIGKLGASRGQNVALDLSQPKGMGIFGYMGSGKSYLLGAIAEGSVLPIQGINRLAKPLSVVIFNYRRNYRERFELTSLTSPNSNAQDIERLAEEYEVSPVGVKDVQVLCLPGELSDARRAEYDGIKATELLFRVSDLTLEDWELLMGEPSSNRLYAQAIRQALDDLKQEGNITLAGLQEKVETLPPSSRNAALTRLNFARRYLREDGIRFADFVCPGRILILDLRKQLFDKSDALRFFLVCANQISQIEATFNKLIIFDEAHEYLSEEFADKIESRIRVMRHEGASYLFATQDVSAIPPSVGRFLGTKFIYNLGTQQNVTDLIKWAPEFRDQRVLSLEPGQCLISSNASVNNVFQQPRLVRVRPRVTQHGGASRIFED